MGGKSGFRAYPKHLGRPRGRGLMVCDASGFVRHTSEATDDVRQGTVARQFADLTPGFGTHHPQDVVQLGALGDPSPAEDGDHIERHPKTKQELGISDAEILASIREGRAPRQGY